jgi:carboxypeptidase Taq
VTVSGDPLIELRTRLAEVSDLTRLGMLLTWDQEIVMPPAGAEWRASQRATLESLTHTRFTADRVGELLDAATPATPVDEDLVRITRRDYDKARRVPPDLVAELVHASATASEAWARAREESDFALLEPHLRRNVELRRRYIDCFPEAERPFDALLDDYEPGMRTAEVEDVLGRLRDGLVPLVAARGGGEDGLIRTGPFPVDAQRRLVEAVLRQVGVDDERWRLDVALHPFQATISPGDLRLTTRYAEADLDSLFGTLHEYGHGLYEAQIEPELARTPLGGGASSAVHESQSRLWENLVGRSRAFCAWVAPQLTAILPGFDDIDAEELYRRVNTVHRNLIRVEADETTYNLHIVLRFELELGLVEGRLTVDDLPHAWNEGMYELLGLDVPDDAQGLLQDVHWGAGMVGYFPTYTLGNLMAAQLWETLSDEVPDIDASIERGDFAPLRDWLGRRIHAEGRRLPPPELLRRVTGQELAVEPFLRYLRGKLAGVGVLPPT